MARLPNLPKGHKICVVCEGLEDTEYFTRLTNLNVWNDSYTFHPINAKSASNIPARYQDAYHNDSYELVLVFCDTDKYPYREYNLVKEKINDCFGGAEIDNLIIIYANPCTMQIILSHFGDVSLKNQGKKTNAKLIEELTGVPNYDAHADQIQAICSKIFRRTYSDMKMRISKINHGDETSASTNFAVFLEKFENEDDSWIYDINKVLENECEH